MKTLVLLKVIFVLSHCLVVAEASNLKGIAGSDALVHDIILFRDVRNNMKHLTGVYEFGESESEWSVSIIPYQEGFIVQTSSVIFSAKNQHFLRIHSTAHKAQASDAFFPVPKPHGSREFFRGKFVKKKESPDVLGILLDGSSLLLEKDAPSEVGFHSRTLEDEFGDHYQLSCVVLDNKSLANKSAFELSLMRNEIYAYYGMIFRKEPLRAYFAKKEWYYPWETDVTDCITDLEWANIHLIQNYEKLIRKSEMRDSVK